MTRRKMERRETVPAVIPDRVHARCANGQMRHVWPFFCCRGPNRNRPGRRPRGSIGLPSRLIGNYPTTPIQAEAQNSGSTNAFRGRRGRLRLGPPSSQLLRLLALSFLDTSPAALLDWNGAAVPDPGYEALDAVLSDRRKRSIPVSRRDYR